jgi:hypothetical protein
MRSTRLLTILALAGAASACTEMPSSPNLQLPFGDLIMGRWQATAPCADICAPLPTLTLYVYDSTVVGFGAWPTGNAVDSLDVAGTFRGRIIEFDVTHRLGGTQHFHGTIDFTGQLAGSWYTLPSGPETRVIFTRAD